MIVKVKVKVNNSNWMRAAEIAHVSMTSPSGKTITVYKKNLSKIKNPKHLKFIHQTALINGDRDITIEGMDLFLQISKL